MPWGQLGVELVDVRDAAHRSSRTRSSDSVYRRMQQSFAAQAAKLRAEGQASAESMPQMRIGSAHEILAAAQQLMRSACAAKATRRPPISTRGLTRVIRVLPLLSQPSGLPQFARTRHRDVIVISPDSEFFHYLQKPEGR